MGSVKPGSVVYLDTNVLIYMAEGSATDRAKLDKHFATFAAARATFITSELAYTEVLVHPLRSANAALISRYEMLLSDLVQPLPVARDVLVLAAHLRAISPAQKTPDAIHVATATLAQADWFVTGDQGIKNLAPSMSLLLV